MESEVVESEVVESIGGIGNRIRQSEPESGVGSRSRESESGFGVGSRSRESELRSDSGVVFSKSRNS